MTGKPTLVSLAAELGVSRQTISNALNAPHRVNARTLERVLPAIRESGYRPHVAGRQLRTGSSRNLAMRLYPSPDGINGAVHDRFLHALTEAGQQHGYRLTLFTASDDDGEVAAIDELLSVADIDGFVLTGTSHGDARTAWLLERGHRRIGFLGWPEGSGVGDDRRAGWRRALEAAGVDVAADELSLGIEDGVADGARGARDLFGRGATALVCASDSLAIGVVAAWRQVAAEGAGSPPVTGFDDTPVAAALGLTSVRQPIEEVAEQAVALLLRRLADADRAAAPEHVLLPSSIVVREPDPHLLGVRFS